MNNNKLLELLKDIADEKIKEIEENGYINPGVNGPYNCIDTPIRNSAHWCVTYAFLYKKTNNEKYLKALKTLANYIYAKQKESKSGAIKCMIGDNFTDTNGLIGQAWTIEGLISAYKILNDNKYLDCAKKIFVSQTFNYDEGEWYQIDTKGVNHGVDLAFNHQLWFACIGLELNSLIDDSLIKKNLLSYLNNLDKHFCIYSDGLIKHLGNNRKKIPLFNYLKKNIKKHTPTHLIRKNPDKYSSISFEAAYQLFNLYAFAIIKKYESDFSIFKSKKFYKALKYGLNINNLNRIFNTNPKGNEKTCKYAYPYNSPAFEYGFVAKTFLKNFEEKSVYSLLDIAIRLCYSKDKKSFDNNTNDSNTLTARIYELVRYMEMIANG